MAALAVGKHVLLEKPPGATVSEIAQWLACAGQNGRTQFAIWHSRFAPAVAPARQFLAPYKPRSVTIIWKEDVSIRHPGQNWIFKPDGPAFFDPGINALSILTVIPPESVFVNNAELDFPVNREAPIAADLTLADASGLPILATFDFRATTQQIGSVHVETDAGTLRPDPAEESSVLVTVSWWTSQGAVNVHGVGPSTMRDVP